MEDQDKVIDQLLEIKNSIKKMDKSIQLRFEEQTIRISKIEKMQELIAKGIEGAQGQLMDYSSNPKAETPEEPVFEQTNESFVEHESLYEKNISEANSETSEFVAQQEPIEYVQPDHPNESEQTTKLDEVIQPTRKIEQSDVEANSIKMQKRKDELEFKIGGIWLNRIAIVLIVFGVAFFLKYAFDNNWVSPTVRVLIGVVFGVAFLVGGELFQNKRYSIFAQGLTGGGIAVLYFSIFAGYYFFSNLNVIPQTLAMVLMILITAASVILALRYDSKAIAFLGLLGGMLTPFLLSTGDNNYLALYIYIFILNIGILLVSYYKKWTAVSNTSFIITELILLITLVLYFKDIRQMFFISEGFFTLFFILYLIIPLIYSARKLEKLTAGQIGLITANIIFYTFISLTIFGTVYPDYIGYFALSVAILLGVIGYWFREANPSEKNALVMLFGSAISFITLAIPLEMYKYKAIDFITLGWTVEAIVLLYAGIKIPNIKMRRAAIILVSITAAKFMFFGIMGFSLYSTFREGYLPVFNKWSVEFLILNAGLFAVWYLYRQNAEDFNDKAELVRNPFLLLANAFLFIQITMEISNYFLAKQMAIEGTSLVQGYEIMKQGIMSITWAVYAIVLSYIGIKKDKKLMRYASLIMISITVVKLLIVDFAFSFSSFSNYLLVFNIRLISAISVAALILLICYLYTQNRGKRDDNEKSFLNTFIMIAVFIIGLALTSESMRYFNSVGADINSNLAKQMQFGISSIWAVYSIILIVIGIIKRYKPVRLFAIVLFGITILKVFLSDLSVLTGVYRVLSFIVLGFILLAVSFLYQKYKDIIIYDLPEDKMKEE